MADASKLKGLRRSGLGVPPPLEEARTDLQPEAAQSNAEPGLLMPAAGVRLDGRSMRRSGRTVQFATRVSPDFDGRIRQIAMRDGLLLVEVLEQALDAYEASRKKAAS
jgi:hypothetical protein